LLLIYFFHYFFYQNWIPNPLYWYHLNGFTYSLLILLNAFTMVFFQDSTIRVFSLITKFRHYLSFSLYYMRKELINTYFINVHLICIVKFLFILYAIHIHVSSNMNLWKINIRNLRLFQRLRDYLKTFSIELRLFKVIWDFFKELELKLFSDKSRYISLIWEILKDFKDS
jgi:hypothetical protein